MKFCQPHWDALRRAIDDRGLSHLVARDGAAAAELLRAQAEGEAGPEAYDPLMAAHNMIASWAVENGGLAMLQGDLCPVCEGMRRVTGVAPEEVERDLLTGPPDAALDYCREHGLVGGEA